ncbi:translocation protein in type III secretion [Pandoraea pneumonica]|uniref:Translocation protein in type III secretion n=1 Tax=Pandoraea pneumonica TaxID=2508299 RepID=A0A5E4W3Q8_9BURK|nr:hypothetical protein [Pandoraea pneumonica]VVE19268.1 translocation protein in type III secretion [Pandoraea pneumonica]
MPPDTRAPDVVLSQLFGGSLGGASSVSFVQDDMQVHVGWLHVGGDGLIVAARVDQGPVGELRFWCDTQQWCDWLAPWLPVPSFDALPQAWLDIAASLTLSGASEEAGEGAFGAVDKSFDDSCDAAAYPAYPADSAYSAYADAWPSATQLTPGAVTLEWRVGMVLQREGRRLALAWLTGDGSQDEASAWLRERCARAMPGAQPLDPAGVPQRDGVLVAGWADISSAQWDALGDGDAVILDKSADVANGAYWVVDGDYALAYPGNAAAQRGAVNAAEVLRFDDCPFATTDGTSPARVFAVLTTQPFPVPTLDAWRTGRLPDIRSCHATHGVASSPDAPVLHTTRVTLWRNGIACGAARLLRFDDGRLAVCREGERKGDMSIAAHDSPQKPTNSGGDLMGVYPLSP